MAIGTLVVIVLAVLVLVVLALGFTTGWSNLYGRMTSFFSSVNVDSVAQACSVAAVAQNKYDYCCAERAINFGEGKKFTVTCDSLANGIDKDNADLGRTVAIETRLTCGADACVSS